MLITFIGGGNMASALISGLANPPRSDLAIRVVDPDDRARARLQATFEVSVYTDPVAAIRGADVVLLAIKPQSMPLVLKNLAGHVRPGQLLLSIAAGITIATLEQQLGRELAVVRCMPNTPALIGHGITGMTAGRNCSAQQRALADEIMAAAGEVVWLEDEALMDAVTAVSGTGPAYFFLLTEVLASTARDLGLPAATADRLAAITCFGAGAMVATSPDEAEDLRRRVTSPGGTTEAAMAVLESGGFRELMSRAVTAAEARSRELSRQTSKDGDSDSDE
ncbi:MAG: pyrroline-5-carboxylate reductase [Xanthomonadales bacterium]|jgi:pyrroline-5-carboxylate reductase|nr:pyrroline-5-carboxylate reductase [Xanthomonadales bacterium]